MRRDYILIAIIIAQAVWGSCERRKYINAQIRANKEQLKEIARNNEKYAKNVISSLDSVKNRQPQITYITRTVEKKQDHIRSVDNDSLAAMLTERYNR
jgi:uncharacterized protein HemX